MLKLLFSPSGAIHRVQYLIGLIASLVVLLAGYLFAYLPMIMIVSMAKHPRIVDIAPRLSFILYAVGCTMAALSLWINFCVHLKRLYDLRVNRLLVIIPFIYAISQKYIPLSIQNTIMMILVTIYVICLLFWPSRREEDGEAA